MKNVKRWCCLIWLLMFLVLPVSAAEEGEGDSQIDVEYTGIVDPVTGQPAGENDSGVVSGENIQICDGVEYDPVSRLYYYTLSNYEQAVSSNVMTGMVTIEPVSIQVPNGLSLRFYRNGELVSLSSEEIEEPGAYVLNLGSGSAIRTILKFTIISRQTGSLTSYRLPSGFTVDEVLLNGQSIDFEPSYIDLTSEGHYQISYHCYYTQETCYLDVEIDHTAPILALNALDEKSIAHGPVDLSDLEDGASMQILRDGVVISNTDKLTQAGNYVVTVCDEAGNIRSYAFTIQVYLNTSSVLFFLMLLAVCIVLTIYLLRNRRRMRVR